MTKTPMEIWLEKHEAAHKVIAPMIQESLHRKPPATRHIVIDQYGRVIELQDGDFPDPNRIEDLDYMEKFLTQKR